MKTLKPGPGVVEGYLGSVPLLAGLDAQRLQRLAACSFLRLYDRGDVLFTTGRSALELLWLAHGAVRVFRLLPDGRERVIHIHPAPSLVAEVPTLLGQPYPASADCTAPSTVVAVPRAQLVELVRADPELSLRLLAASMDRLRELTRAVAHQGRLSALSRVAAYLLGLAAHHSELSLPAPKKDVASLLGLTPESLSRALTTLRKRGAIEMSESEIRLVDRGSLESLLV